MRFFTFLFVFWAILIRVTCAASNQVTLLDPVQEQLVHAPRVVLDFGVFNRSKNSQRLIAKLNTLTPGARVGFYTRDKVINRDKFDQFVIGRSAVRISPRRISLGSGKMRPFRVAVNLKGSESGTYFGNILIKQLPVKKNVITDEKETKSKDFSVKLDVLFDQYAAFYLNKGKGNPFDPLEGQKPVKIECTVDKENKNLTLHIYNDTSYALRSSVRSDAVSDKVYRVITVLPYTEATRDVVVPMKKDLKTPFKLDFLIKNKEVSSVMCS